MPYLDISLPVHPDMTEHRVQEISRLLQLAVMP